MNYALVLLLLFVLEILYFRLASHFNIVDKPNLRSSHTDVTPPWRRHCILFCRAIIFRAVRFPLPMVFLGLTLMTIVSFLDDVFTLSNKLRLLIHFSAVLLMAYELNVFEMPWYILLITFIIIVGVINAYNFMDGINGITACYSLAVGGLLLLTNRSIHFIDQDLLIYAMIGVLVFTFFNFRAKAKCFAGDVGSVAIAYILLFALGALILKTQNVIYILFLAVYGIDTVWTIVQRLYRRENIFKAHRSHLYQYLGNEAGVDKLFISFSYGMAQILIGVSVLYFAQQSFALQILFSVGLILLLSIAYLIGKGYIIKRYVR